MQHLNGGKGVGVPTTYDSDCSFGWDRLACVFIHGIQHAHKVRICSSRKKKLVTKPGNMSYFPTK